MRTVKSGIGCLGLVVALLGCDGPTATPSEPRAAETDAAISGRITFDSEALAPVSWADVELQPLVPGEVAEAPPAAGYRRALIELQADQDGFFAAPALGDDVRAASLDVYVDGTLAHHEVLTLDRGRAPRSIAISVALGAWGLCIGSTWGSALVELKSAGNDKLEHCVASCRAQRYCGGALVAATLKEILDTLCSKGPQWVKKILAQTGVSACGGWDSADMAADTQGIACGYRWSSCLSCCDGYY